MSEILHQTLGETVQIETVFAAGVWAIFVDSNQLESALLNLAVNSRDAMPHGGKLTIEAANTYLDEAYSAIAEVPAGQYVGIFVSDTGTGMAPEVASKELADQVKELGFDRIEHLGPEEAYARYFAGRADSLPCQPIHSLIRARTK